MKYELNTFNRNVPDIDLLNDLKRVADQLGTNRLSSRDYDENGGKYTSGTMGARFGSWNKALERASLQSILKHNASVQELFRNIETVWINLGRQPVSRDLKRPLSDFSQSTYIARFGTFRKALEAFVKFINLDIIEKDNDIQENVEIAKTDETIFKHKTKRYPSERLKVQVLMRDGNRCRLCEATLTGDNIHFDHIIPWSKGGETLLENLQILCALHNLAKGDLDSVK